MDFFTVPDLSTLSSEELHQLAADIDTLSREQALRELHALVKGLAPAATGLTLSTYWSDYSGAANLSGIDGIEDRELLVRVRKAVAERFTVRQLAHIAEIALERPVRRDDDEKIKVRLTDTEAIAMRVIKVGGYGQEGAYIPDAGWNPGSGLTDNWHS